MRAVIRFLIAVTLGVVVSLIINPITLFVVFPFLDTPTMDSDIGMLFIYAFVVMISCIVAVTVYSFILKPKGVAETRCRKCGYILKGISEPKCSECGEVI